MIKIIVILILTPTILMAQNITKLDFIRSFNEYLNNDSKNNLEGFYKIDISKSNIHTYNNLQIALKEDINGFNIHLIDADCYTNLKTFNPGEIIGSSSIKLQANTEMDLSFNENINQDVIYNTGFTLKIESDSLFLFKSNGVNIGIDHFKKATVQNLSNIYFLNDLSFRYPTREEIETLDFEFQSGLELMGWLIKDNFNTKTKDSYLNSLELAFDSLNKIKEYPIGEYNSVWHATFGLTNLFANQLKNEYSWDWVFFENSKFNETGWYIISKDKRFGIFIDNVFYENVMFQKTVLVNEFYKIIENHIRTNSIPNGQILIINIPCD